MKLSPAVCSLTFSSRRFFSIFLIVVIAQLVDSTIGSLADILKDFTVSFWGVVLFVGISIAYGLAIFHFGNGKLVFIAQLYAYQKV